MLAGDSGEGFHTLRRIVRGGLPQIVEAVAAGLQLDILAELRLAIPNVGFRGVGGGDIGKDRACFDLGLFQGPARFEAT